MTENLDLDALEEIAGRARANGKAYLKIFHAIVDPETVSAMLARIRELEASASPAALTDAQITTIWLNNGGSLNGNNYRAFARALLAAPPADQVGWIPVSERLPDEAGEYLVYRPDAHRKPAADPNTCIREYTPSRRPTADGWGGVHRVTHWMPLPPAPMSATPPAAEASPAMRKAVKDAMAHARQWISSAQHGDNCFVSRRYEGDPGDGCNCGKDSALEAIDRVDFDESVSPTHKVADARDANVRSEGFRDCIDAIKGCIEFGRQGVMQPPEGHWLAEFWEIGRQISDAARYRFIKREGIVLAGGPWPIAPFGDGCDRHIDAAMSASKEGA